MKKLAKRMTGRGSATARGPSSPVAAPSTSFLGLSGVLLNGHVWLWVPLALTFACATAQEVQEPAVSAGKSTRVEEAPGPTQLLPFHGEGGFTVLMPPKPYQSERTENTPGGTVHVRLAQVRDEMAKYLASVSEFPKGSLDRIPSKDLLESLQRSTIKSMNGTLVSTQDVEVSGLPGREFTATDPQGSEVTARVFVGDSRLYTLAGTYPQGPIPGSIRQFLDSFQPPAATGLGNSGGGASTNKSPAR